MVITGHNGPPSPRQGALDRRHELLYTGDMAGGMSEDQLLNDFPQITVDDIRACLAYAAEREQRTTGIPAA